jgi:hypothetical protein
VPTTPEVIDLPLAAESTRKPAEDPLAGLPLCGLALVAAVAAGVIAQGGFYLPGRLVMSALVLFAAAAAVWAARPSRADTGLVTLTCAALATWALARGVAAGAFFEAMGWVLSLTTVVAVLIVVRRLDTENRERLLVAVIAILVGVAVTGWIGVAFRVPLWALVVEHQWWRASSTLTYPNAAAAVLVVGALLALVRLFAAPYSIMRALTVFALVTGLGATLSRAGALAFAVGLVVLALAGQLRALLWHGFGPLLGALVAVAGLAPSVPSATQARPAVAIAALAAGAALTVTLTVLRAKARLAALGVVLAAAGAAVTRWRPSSVDSLLDARFTLSSSGRRDATNAALERLAERPLTGAGPGQAYLFFVTPDGRGGFARYVHNEYLQTLVDIGVIGFALVLAVFAALVLAMRRCRPLSGEPRYLWAGAIAAFAALALHSAFDFLWQLSVVPVLGALVAGFAGTVHSGDQETLQQNGECA